MTTENVFKNLATVDENPNMLTFELAPTNVAYANTLRRMVLTGVESVAFDSTMNDKGKTTNVTVMENTTPMTNEMLADRIGLIPLHADPQSWKKNDYYFLLKVENTTDSSLPVTAADFQVYKRGAVIKQDDGSNTNTEEDKDFEDETNWTEYLNKRGDEEKDVYREANVNVGNKQFFHPDPKTGDTSLIALLKAKQPNQAGQKIKLVATASVGTGRKHIRYSPVSQCSYGYTIDDDDVRQREQFEKWIQSHKNKTPEEFKDPDNKKAEEVLLREFQTMEVQRCFKMDPTTGEPNSFDFVIESLGVQTVESIVERALQNIQAKCLQYAAMDKQPPENVRIQPADARMKGFDFLFQYEDHTLGNLLQTYMEEHMMSTNEISFVGYKVPHPLRDEMVLRVGVDLDDKERDGQELTATEAVAKASKACADIFGSWLTSWRTAVQAGKGRRNLKSLRLTAANAKEKASSADMAKQVAQRNQSGKVNTYSQKA